MGGFGNYMGAVLGGEYDDSLVVRHNYPTTESQALVDNNGNLVDIPTLDMDAVDKLQYQPDSDKLRQVPGLISDDDTYQEVSAALHGARSLNWEDKTFKFMKEEKDALEPTTLNQLADAWKTHGDNLKKESENFKNSVQNHISGNWSGASAQAADAATQHVTKTSIFDFTPSSDALSGRLKVLSEAFSRIKSDFPEGNDLIDGGDFNEAKLNSEVQSFNSRYHLDGGGRLRNNSDGYVAASTAYEQMQRLRRSISDYQRAVQLFRDVYNPAVLAATDNFPDLPAPPDMTFNPTGPGPTGPGPGTGPGGGPGGGPPALGGSPKLKNPNGIKPFETPKLPNTKLPDTKLPDTKLPTTPTVPTSPTGLNGLTDPVKSAMDAATNAAKDAIGQAADAAKSAGQGLQDPNLGGPKGPPEGVLGLGPQGLGAGGASKGAGGVGGGAMPRGLAAGTAMNAPATAAAKAPAPATGAGLASGAGAPGAGAPAAGQRGDQNGKGHQVNKALRRKKNGKDVIGDAEAVVAVVGAADEQDQADGSQGDQQEHRRRIPQRGTSWQPDSALHSGPRPPQGHRPGSATPEQLMDQ